MNNVIYWQGITKIDLPPERVIDRAAQAGLKSVVIIGFKEGEEFYFASSYADGGDVLWLLELAKKKLFEIGDPST